VLLLASVLSVALSCTFFALLRLGAPRWTYAILGVLPPALLLLASPGLRVYGYHGFIQAGIVYQLLLGHVPPASPLLAAEPGTYPWVGALVLAGLCRMFGISPWWAAAIVAIGALVVLLLLTYRIGLLVGDPDTALFGAAASLYAFTFTQSVPYSGLKATLAALLPFPFQEPRGAPILEKFNGCTAFPLGLALYALALLVLLRLAARGAAGRRQVLALGASLAGVAFVYPFLFPPLALLCVVAAALAWRDGREGRGLALRLFGVLALVSASVLPYYLALGSGRSAPALQLVSFEALTRHAGVILVTLLPPAILALWARRAIAGALRTHGRAARLLVASGAINLVLFTFGSAPLASEYKFLLLAILAFGIVGGIAFRTLQLRLAPVALAVLSLFLLPFGLDCVHKATGWNETPVFREVGVALEHVDPAARELDAWMRTSTDPRAVFVDSDAAVPVYGQRALYVALAPSVPRPPDGFSLPMSLVLLGVDGHPEDVVDRRQRIATRLLAGADVESADLADVARAGTHAYVVFRRPVARPQGSRFPVVFENAAATVVELPR
jgi:hypothetical protein